ncbi:MAG: PEP-CTERM sorting domain-containing protein [Burkholderiales bacterium]
MTLKTISFCHASRKAFLATALLLVLCGIHPDTFAQGGGFGIAPISYDPGMTFAPPDQPRPPPSARRVPVYGPSGAEESESLYGISCAVTGACGGHPVLAYEWIGGWGAKAWGSNNPSILTKTDGSPAFIGGSTSIDVVPGTLPGSFSSHVVMQSFTALDTGALTHFAVYVDEGRNAVAPVSWRVTAGEAGAPVDAGFFQAADSFRASNGWNEVVARTGIGMTAGQIYTLFLGFDAASTSVNSVRFGTAIATQTGDFYQGGRLFRESSTEAGAGSVAAQEIVYPDGAYDPWTQPDPYRQDLLFAFSVSAVPEPDAAALMLMGVSSVLLWSRRRVVGARRA